MNAPRCPLCPGSGKMIDLTACAEPWPNARWADVLITAVWRCEWCGTEWEGAHRTGDVEPFLT